MKKLLLLTAGLSLATGAQAADFSVTTDFTATTEYVFRGVEGSGGALQPSIELTIGKFNTGIWSNQPLRSKENNEVDFYAGFTTDLTPRFKFEGVFTNYWYPEATRSLGQTVNTNEIGGGITMKLGALNPSVYAYYDFNLKATTVIGAIGTSVPIGPTSFDFSVSLAGVDIDDGTPELKSAPKFSDRYSYWGLDATVPFKLAPNATLSFGAHYTTLENFALAGGPLGAVGKENLWFTAGVSIGF